MAVSKKKQAIAIFFTVLIFIVYLIFQSLALKGTPHSLFPKSVMVALQYYHLQLEATSSSMSVWGVVFAYQIIWIIYTITTLFRNGEETNILSIKFYFTFIVNLILDIIWLFFWTREEAVPTFIVITLGQFFTDLSIGLACSDLADFLSTHEVSPLNKVDIWCQRILVQNGLLFYGSWTTFGVIINTAAVFSNEIGASSEIASLIALSLFGVLLIMWFVAENFIIYRYTEYTLTAYIATICAFSGILAKSWGDYYSVSRLTLALLVLSVIFFIARIVIFVVRGAKRKSYETIGYSSKNEAINMEEQKNRTEKI